MTGRASGNWRVAIVCYVGSGKRAAPSGTSATEPRPASGELELVQRFVNTRVGDDDVLVDSRRTAAWIADAGFGAIDVDAGSLAQLRELRSAVLLTLMAHNGDASDEDAARALSPICEQSTLTLTVGTGGPQVTGTGSGVAGVVNSVLARMAVAAIDGSWSRLKACTEPTCRAAFWDATRNGSARYCSSSGCGNRARQRDFRQRHR